MKDHKQSTFNSLNNTETQGLNEEQLNSVVGGVVVKGKGFFIEGPQLAGQEGED